MFEEFDQMMEDMGKSIKKGFDRLKKEFDDSIGTRHNYKMESGEDETTTWKSETWTDRTGLYTYSSRTVYSKSGNKVTRTEEKHEPTKDELQKEMEKAAAEHNYERAAEIRDRLKKMEDK